MLSTEWMSVDESHMVCKNNTKRIKDFCFCFLLLSYCPGLQKFTPWSVTVKQSWLRRRTEGGKPSWDRTDPWPRTGRIPEWRRRKAAASGRGCGRSRWSGIRRRIRFRLRSRPHRRWQRQRRWTWPRSQCPCAPLSSGVSGSAGWRGRRRQAEIKEATSNKNPNRLHISSGTI